MRRTALLGTLALLTLAAPADARRPLVAYNDADDALRFYDAETGSDTAGPPLVGADYFFRRITLSHNGRFVVFRLGGRVHLYDRAPGLERRLPGIGDGSFVTTTNDGRYVGYDAGSNPPTRIYDRDLGRLLTEAEIGLPQDGTGAQNKLRQPVFSGDGSRVVGTEFGCSGGSDSDTCLYELFPTANVAQPDIATDDEDPCTDADGSLVGVTAPVATDGFKHDLFLADVGAAAFTTPAAAATSGEDERFCYLDSTGDYILYNNSTGARFLYERSTGTFVSLPAAVAGADGVAGLLDPFTPPPYPGPRKPIVGYLTAAGAVGLWDAEQETHLTPPGITVPASPVIREWSMSHNARYIVWIDATFAIHLFDREAGAEVALPGIDQFTDPADPTSRPGSLTVSNGGRIAFDTNGNGPTRVYESGAFVATSPPAKHAQPRISGNGRYLATICRDGPPGCASDLGSDDSAYLHDLETGQDLALPENPAALTDRGESRPCVDGDGSIVGYHVSQVGANARDIHLFDRSSSSYPAFPPGVMDLVTAPDSNDWNCRLDPSGDWVGFEDASFGFHVYSRANDGFLLLPEDATTGANTVWLAAPDPLPAPPAADGGTGGGGGGAPPEPIFTPGLPGPAALPAAQLDLRLRAKALQRLAKRRAAVVVQALCSIPCSLRASAIASVPGRAKALRLRPARGVVTDAGKAVTLRLRVPAKTARAIRRALRRSRRARVPVTITVADPKARVTARKRIRLRR